MLIVISPAKALDFQTPLPLQRFTQADHLSQAQRLIDLLRQKSPAEVAALMSLSDPLAVLNVTRYAEWALPFTPENARPAIFAFNGDVYEGFDARSLDEAALDYAQTHMRILSGLYGVLRPLDLMQAYRLEMGTKLVNDAGRDLYAFWGDIITETLKAHLATLAPGSTPAVLVNLASNEYFKSVRVKKLGARVVTPVFEDWNGQTFKIVSFYAKRARGLMSRYAALNRVQDAEALKQFDYEGYAFEPRISTEDTWIFRRNVK